MSRVLAGLGVAVLTLAFAGAASAERRVALVIGNADYDLVTRLDNPANDAALMTRALEAVGFEVIVETDADRRTMARAIKEFGKTLRAAGPETVGLFYYAGHGVQAAGANYLLPLDAPVVDEADLEIEAVSAQWVLGQMESAGNALNMVILDACRNNPYRGTFRAATRGLARMDAPSGSLVAYSAGPGKVAYDGAGENSPYTAALAAAMTEPGLDIEDVFKTVRRSVETETNGNQTPWEESSLKGDFYFVAPGGTTAADGSAQAVPVAALDKEALFWETVRDSGNVAMFEEYKRRYPDGTFAGLAELKIQELTSGDQTAALPPAVITLGGPGPADIERGLGLSREERKLIQQALNDLKLDAGAADGIFGSRTRTAIGAWQAAANAEDTSYLTGDQAKALIALGRGPQVAVGTYGTSAPPAQTPGAAFRDCPDCPEMVVVPAGSFLMGSPETEAGRSDNEGPQHRVRIAAPFAVGRFEVTRDQFDAFVRDTGRSLGSSCWTYEDEDWQDRPGRSYRDPGFAQSRDHPAVCVNWDDAKAYVNWLSRKTGQTYRLLSEADWEYVARAGAASRFGFGDGDGEVCRHGNGADQTAKRTYAKWITNACDDGVTHTASVGTYARNRFGLHDLHGNVWEWTEDCWSESYADAPATGAARSDGDCARRALRGGSWFDSPRYLRAANRTGSASGIRGSYVGFRVARTLTP